jgi:hypothetical protein
MSAEDKAFVARVAESSSNFEDMFGYVSQMIDIKLVSGQAF